MVCVYDCMQCIIVRTWLRAIRSSFAVWLFAAFGPAVAVVLKFDPEVLSERGLERHLAQL